MVKPIGPEESSRIYSTTQTSEREKMVELEWEMAVLGAFLSATEKNGDLKKSAGQIENQKSHGMPPEFLGREVNSLISQINSQTKTEAPFPHFYFSDQSKTLVLETYLRSFEAYYKALKNKIDLTQFERTHGKEIAALFSSNISISDHQALFRRIEVMMEALNRYLPQGSKLPKLPQSVFRG